MIRLLRSSERLNRLLPSSTEVLRAVRVSVWCREQDLNLHAFWALDPKSNASANSAIPALSLTFKLPGGQL
jgi:hypothetical protein